MEERGTEEINKIWSDIIRSEIIKLKEGLGINEDEFLSFDMKDPSKALEWWMYSILDDLMRFQIKVISMRDILNLEGDIALDQKIENERQNGIDYKRLLYETFSFELDYWHRKIYEHFIYVLYLTCTKEHLRGGLAEVYYQVINLIDFINHLKDDKDYYSIENQGNENGLSNKIAELSSRINLIGLDNIFFLKSTPKSNSKDLHFFESIKQLQLGLIKKNKLAQNDILCLKITYEEYHELSKSIHAYWHQFKDELIQSDLSKQINHINLIVLRMIGYIGIISGIATSEIFQKLLNEPLPDNINFFRQNFKIGETVTYSNYSCKIKEFEINDSGFYRYKIQRLDSPGMSLWVRQEKLVKNILTYF